MNPKSLLCGMSAVSVLLLWACQTGSLQAGLAEQESRWFNVTEFGAVDDIGTSPYDLEFNITYSGSDGGEVRVKNCVEVSYVGNDRISEVDFSRWVLLQTNCEAARRFYDAPEEAVSYWPLEFDFSLLKTFPSTSVPNLGGQYLEGRIGSIREHEETLSLVESGEHSVQVSLDGVVVNYVVLARGDFNRDGYQDLFLRMDWYIGDAFGGGHDWVVLTKRSSSEDPILLWRK